MNTSDSVYGGKEVRPLADVPHEERAHLRRYQDSRVEKHPNHVVVGTQLYDEMVDQDDPEPIQELPAEGFYAVVDVPGSGLEVRPLSGIVVMSDGQMFGTVVEDETLDEVEGFQGIVCCERPPRSEEAVLKLLDETRL